MKYVLPVAIIGLAILALGTQGGTAHPEDDCTIGLFVYGMNGPNCRPGPGACDLNFDHCTDLADFAILQNAWAP